MTEAQSDRRSESFETYGPEVSTGLETHAEQTLAPSCHPPLQGRVFLR
jgi:hypothetical protein